MGYLDSLYAYLIISAPYLLLGVFVSGLVRAFISVDLVKKWLGKRRKRDIFTAAAVGVPIPLCSCSVIPAAVTLKKSGASNAATSSFLISTPESGVDSIALTYGLIDPVMALIRPIAAFISAIFAGVLQLMFNEKPTAKVESDEKSEGHSCCSSKIQKSDDSFLGKLKSGMVYAFTDLINDLSFWLTVGILAGALIDYLVPADFFLTINDGWQSRVVILAIGIPLYICASASTPIAASLMIKGLSPGSALLLLLVGPATNISNIAVLQKYIGKRGVILNIFSIIFVALILSYVTDFLYANYFDAPKLFNKSAHEHMSHSWWEIASVIALGGLLLKGLVVEEVLPRLKSKEHNKEGTCH